MTTNQRSFFSSKCWTYEKCLNLIENVKIYNKEFILDNCESLWKLSKNNLDFYWNHYFNEYKTCFQDTFDENNEMEMPYNKFLKQIVEDILSNKFYGLVKVESYTDTDVWTIFSSILPTTVFNCLRYTPFKMENNEITAEYIIYQIISAVEELHLSNIPHLSLTLDNIYMNENFVLKLSLPELNLLSERGKVSFEQRESKSATSEESKNLDNILWQWMCGNVTNLDYLLYLNKLAGRSDSDPNNHCMIPWVTDFREPYGGLRDLKLSKFRINKGDDHLDKIYQDQLDEFEKFENTCPLDYKFNRSPGCNLDLNYKLQLNTKSRTSKSKSSITEFGSQSYDYQPSYPHHVSDILSELSYYAYMARVTPIDILKKSYRSFYNPQEFKWDMKKMYDWTPDECIPQFFTDPSVFHSMHPDMPDIELPEWCKDAEEFVKYHREILESSAVGAELHNWIDLVFGYKLQGNEAVAAKNIHRQFADKSTKMTNNGLTILFRSPHPKRLCNVQSLKKYFGSTRPQYILDKDPINTSTSSDCLDKLLNLPEDYNPCELIDYYKEYCSFIQDSCVQEAVEVASSKPISKPFLEAAFEEDIISICCLIIEIFNYDKLRADYLISSKNLQSRIECCYLLLIEDPSRIPLKFRDSTEKMMNNYRGKSGCIPSIFTLKKSEKWLLFNKSTIKLFDVIQNIYSLNTDRVIAVKHFFLHPTGNYKFNLQTLNLITPHLIYLLKESTNFPLEKVLDILVCITQKFGLITGKNYFIKEILPHVINLYPLSKHLIKSQHALLYQRNFLNLLLIRIGMMDFLNNITELLVHMLVIGQQIFGSTKDISMPEIDLKQISNDTDSLNESEGSSVWYVQNGDDDNIRWDPKTSQLLGNSDNESSKTEILSGTTDPDSVSLYSIDVEESKIGQEKYNGYIPSVARNVSDNLPLSDPEIIEDITVQSKNRNGSFTQLFVSPFRKPSAHKQKMKQSKSSKIEIRQNMSQDCSKTSIARLSCSSLIWLTDLVGPVQATSRILSELLAQFLSCYQNFNFDDIQVDILDESKISFVTGTSDSCIQADFETTIILDCMREFVALYGLAVVDRQFRHFLDTLLDKKNLTDHFGENRETNLICSVSLLRFLGMIIPDDSLESFLADKVLDNYLPLIIKCIGNISHFFRHGVKTRKVLLHKTIDLIYLLSTRIKYDQFQVNMGNVLKLLFDLFNIIFNLNDKGDLDYREMSLEIVPTTPEDKEYIVKYSSDENDLIIHSNKVVVTTPPSIIVSLVAEKQSSFDEIKAIVTTELAYVLYITFAKLLGQNRLNTLLYNHSLIQAIVSQYENDTNRSSVYSSPDKIKQQKLEETLQIFTTSMGNHKKRHLVSNDWKRYWEYELGFCDSESFDIKQMPLGKFEGHNNTIKGFDVLNCENGFLSYSKDKIVKLFSCADIDYSNISSEVVARYNHTHQKPVNDALFIEQMGMAVSLDGSFHLWDPFIGKRVFDSSFGVSNSNWNMVCRVPPAHLQVAVASVDGRVQIVDLRSGVSTYYYNLNINNTYNPPYGDFASSMGVPGGFIKQIYGAPNGNQLIIGNSEGFLSVIELRMSRLLQTLRPHQSEITQIKFLNNWCVTSSMEPNGKLFIFSLSNLSKSHSIYGPDLGAIHSLMIFRNQLLVGASQNRFGLFSNIMHYESLDRLSSTLYKGTVSTASLLLHNKLLLLGNDTGNISLWY